MGILFSPYRPSGVDPANRLVVAPICQFSAVEGCVQPWHATHVGTLIISAAGLKIVESTAV